MTTYATFLVSNLTLTPSLYSSTITLRVPLTATSALLSTTPGTTFVDGTTSKTTTGYITVFLNSNDARIWNIQDTFPYAGYADLERLTAATLDVRSTMYMGAHMDITGRVSTFSTMFTLCNYTQKGEVIPTTYLFASTIEGLASIGYISSASYAIASTIDGLGSICTTTTYISTGRLVSTVDGLGTLYVSYASLISSISGNTIFIRTSNLVSTVDGLGASYMSTPAIQSTIGRISTMYMPFSSNISTVSSLISMEGLSLASTVTNLGSFYISSPALQSTVNGLGNFYVSSAQTSAFISSADYTFSRDLLSNMFTHLGSGSNGYMSTPQLFSSVAGIQIYTPQPLTSNVRSLGYISTLDLFSTIPGLSPLFVSSASLVSTVITLQLQGGYILNSTFDGLGTSRYISIPSLISTTTFLSNTYFSNLVSSYANMGRYYMSTGQLLSTVDGLGSLALISTASLTSSSLGYINYVLLSIVNLAGSNYVSTSGLISTTTGLISSFSNQLTSTVRGLGSTYMSTPNITSTVAGLGTGSYISLASLFSSGIQYVNYENIQLEAMVNNPSNYVSTVGLVSTTTGLISSFSNQLTSTVNGLGITYMSTPNITSTVAGLGTASYISIASLVSSAIQYVNYENLQLQAMVDSPSNYVSTAGLVSTTTGLLAGFSNQLISTVNGLGSTYMSTPNITSTVAGLGTASYISIASLVSSGIQYVNYENLQLQAMVNSPSNYVSTSSFVSTTSGLIGSFSNQLISTVNGLASVTTPQVISTVQGLGSSSYISIASLISASIYYLNYESLALQQLVNTAGFNVYTGYISTSGHVKFTVDFLNEYIGFFTSTLYGLKYYSYISSPQLISTVNGLSSPTYISTAHLISATRGFSNIGSSTLVEMITNIGQTYISRGGLFSTTTGLTADFSNIFSSTFDGLATSYYISTDDLTSSVAGLQIPLIPSSNFIPILSTLVRSNSSQLTSQTASNTTVITATYFPASGFPSTTAGYLTSFSNGLTSMAVGMGTAGYLSSAHITSTVSGLGLLSYLSTPSLLSTTTSFLTNFGVQLVSTTTGLGSSTYISTPHLVSSVQGLGLQSVSTASLTSTITFLTASYALSSMLLFENTLGSNYISSLGIVSTVIGLSNIYITGSNLQSTVAGMGTLGYVSSSRITSTITGISIQQSNLLPLLTSTVAGLGNIYFSTLAQPLANSPALCNTVAYFAGGYINTFAAIQNGYLYSDGSTSLLTTNFYETSNLSYTDQSISVDNSISANIVRTITFGPYLDGNTFGTGNGLNLTISSDSNLKQDIMPLSPSESLDQITSMRGVYYKMIYDSTPYIGCIAQEVEEVFPEVITTHVGESNWKAMKYEFLLAPLVESVKELSHIHSTLKYFVRKNQGNIQ